MDKEEFKKYCEENDDNLVTKWDYKKFKIKCLKCNSENVKAVDNIELHEGSSCPTCGYESYNTGKIVIKCLDCGSAMQVLDIQEIDN